MLTFLRKIRKSFIESLPGREDTAKQAGGSARKYLLYAIGEIILVVIGILIAVQLNNYNEDRKRINDLDRLLIDLEEFMDTQNVIMSGWLNIILQSDSLYKEIEKSRSIQALSIPASSLRSQIFDTSRFPYYKILPHQIQFTNINNLLERKEDFPKKYWSMIYDLESLKVYADEIVIQSESLSTINYDHLNYIIENKSDVFDHSKNGVDAFTAYILEDPIFEMRLKEITTYLEDIISAMRLYNFNSAKLNATIKFYLHDESGEQLEKLWSDYDLEKLNTSYCNIDQKEVPLSPTRYGRILVFNDQSQSIQVEYLNKEQESIRKYTIDEKGIFTMSMRGKRIGVEYTIGDECFEVSNPKGNTFIIIK